MLARIGVIAFNTYREAARARILLGLFGLAIATAGYAMVVASYASRSALRVISDIGTFSISVYAVIVAVVMGATSLYREVELKTIFPILARPIWREEYLLGKYGGTLLTLLVFMLANAGVLLVCLALHSAESPTPALVGFIVPTIVCAGLGFRVARWRTPLLMLWSVTVLLVGIWTSGDAVDDRRVVLSGVSLSFLEVMIVTAIATVFSAFTSPFLTAVMTAGVFLVGRSADTLAKLPARVFGEGISEAGKVLSKVFPNLMVYVPPRPLLTGESAEVAFSSYVLDASLQAVGWAVALLVVAGWMFRRRDFT